jgi:hypothetical protein
LHVNDGGYLEMQRRNVMVYENKFHGVFRDQKLPGVVIIELDFPEFKDG